MGVGLEGMGGGRGYGLDKKKEEGQKERVREGW